MAVAVPISPPKLAIIIAFFFFLSIFFFLLHLSMPTLLPLQLCTPQKSDLSSSSQPRFASSHPGGGVTELKMHEKRDGEGEGGRELDGVYSGPSEEDLMWLTAQLDRNGVREVPQNAEEWHQMRKGINPRTREQQITDLRKFKGISHYEEGLNHTALPCPAELLVEEHHSNYGEPWAGGRDVFEFLAKAVSLRPKHQVLEIGCGTLRVGLHFIRFLLPAHYHCVERDHLSLMASLRYEIPSQGLIHKRPLIVKGEDMNFDSLGHTMYDLIYASAVFLHMPDALVWTGLERLVKLLVPGQGRIFVSHNIKFCTRLPVGVCQERLSKLKLTYVGKHTHDSLLFNHYEIWHEFNQTTSIS